MNLRSLLVFALLATSVVAAADITQDGHASWIRTNAPGTYNASASDKLVVVVSGEHNFAGNLTGNCTAVTYNGQALTLAIIQMPVNYTSGGHGQTHSSIWYLDNPGAFSGPGTIAVTCNGTSWVATAVGLSGTLPGVGSTAKVSRAASTSLTTSGYGSMVISALGMGGNGNTATPLPGITANSPAQASTIAGLRIGSNWAGHAVAHATIHFPSAQMFGFNTAVLDVTTIAAEFKAANPAFPVGPTPTVLDVVPGESVQLTWANLLPHVGNDVWADLWIGDSPSNLTRVVAADPDGLNLTSFTFEAPAPGVYHGRIDSYLNGAPSGAPLTGQNFTFEVSSEGLLVEKWLGLRPLASVVLLQQEGIAVRGPDHSERVVASALTNLPAPAGVRMRGLLTPDEDGEYTLHIAGSQNVALWLSTDDSRFNKQRVAWHLETTAAAEWNKFSTQKSAPIQLLKDVSYYIEAQVMNGAGIGHIALGWTPPGATTPEPIPAGKLRYPPVDLDDLIDNNLPDTWEEEDTDLYISELPGARSEYGDPDQDGISNFDEYRIGSDPLDPEELANGITREIWTSPGMAGAPLSALTSSPRFYDFPNEIAHASGIDDAFPGTQFGVRYRGFLIAPKNGSYRFWITGNDEVQLWIADGTITPLGDPIANRHPRTDRFGKRLIAYNLAITTNIDWGTRHQFDRTPSQRSESIHLAAGQVYYIEVLHKQGWGNTDSHASVAWQVPGLPREIIPATAFLANSPHPEDLDDDGLPDAWQSAPENNLNDPALTAVQRGQFGDPDGDGLINLLEYQYGTLPRNPDTDGDGLSDYEEIFYYGTDPTFPNIIETDEAASPTLHQYTAYTGGWTHNPDGTLSAWDPRGEITYSFNLEEPGVHEIVLTGAAIGNVRSTERLPIVLSLNDQAPFSRGELVSTNFGGQGTVKAVTPWLAAGPHTLTILHDNYLSARRLRIDSIQIHRLGGQDLDNNQIPDWIEENAIAHNKLTQIPTHSRTSPVSIEGITQYLPTALLEGSAGVPPASSVALELTPSINQTFFTNILLSEEAPTTLTATFLDGLVTETHDITWIPTNLLDTFPDDTLHIRQHDALRLHAAVEGASGSFIIQGVPVEGASGSFTTEPTSSNTPLTLTFHTPGLHTLTATWTPEEGPAQQATVTLHVHSADFGPNLSVRTYSARTMTPPTLDSLHQIETDERLIFHETTSPLPVGEGQGEGAQHGPRTFSVNLHQAGMRHVIARLPADIEGAPSAILARGTIHGFHIAYLNDTRDAQVIHRYDDGTYLMSGTLIAVNLPADVLIRLRTINQGTLFHNGENTLWLDASHFNPNGSTTIYYEWAGEGAPRLCNRLALFIQQ